MLLAVRLLVNPLLTTFSGTVFCLILLCGAARRNKSFVVLLRFLLCFIFLAQADGPLRTGFDEHIILNAGDGAAILEVEVNNKRMMKQDYAMGAWSGHDALISIADGGTAE